MLLGLVASLDDTTLRKVLYDQKRSLGPRSHNSGVMCKGFVAAQQLYR